MFVALCSLADRFETKKDVIMSLYVEIYQMLARIVSFTDCRQQYVIATLLEGFLGCQATAT